MDFLIIMFPIVIVVISFVVFFKTRKSFQPTTTTVGPRYRGQSTEEGNDSNSQDQFIKLSRQLINQEILAKFQTIPSHENSSKTSKNQPRYRLTKDANLEQNHEREEDNEEFGAVDSGSISAVSTNSLKSMH